MSLFDRAIVCLDGSERSERSLGWVELLAPRARMTLLRVIEWSYAAEVYPGILLPEAKLEAEGYLRRLSLRLASSAELEVRLGSAAPSILDLADEKHADLTAIATHGGAQLRRRIFGGTVESLIRGTRTPLLVVPSWIEDPREAKISRILVPLDGTSASETVLPLADRIASDHGARLVLAHVVSSGEASEAREKRIEELAEERGATPVIISGTLPESIWSLTTVEQADMILMSARGRGPFRRLLRGSTASTLLRGTPVPVLVLRSGMPKARQASEPELAAGELH